jgi:hypothetical protein
MRHVASSFALEGILWPIGVVKSMTRCGTPSRQTAAHPLIPDPSPPPGAKGREGREDDRLRFMDSGV